MNGLPERSETIEKPIGNYTEVKLEIAEIKYTVEQIAKKQKGHDQNIELLFEYIDRLQETTPSPSSKGVTQVKGFEIGSKKE